MQPAQQIKTTYIVNEDSELYLVECPRDFVQMQELILWYIWLSNL